jgi:hypothetical protein
MTCNQPVLPLATAAACVLATLSGLALATSSLAAQHLSELVWRVLAGAGLVPVFLLLRVVELPGQGLASEQTAYTVALAVAGELVNHVDRVAQKGDVADVQAEFARSLRQGVCGR